MAIRGLKDEGRGREHAAVLLDRLLREHGSELRRQTRAHSDNPVDAEEALGDACVRFLRCFDGADEEHARRWMLLEVKRCAWAIPRARKRRQAILGEIAIVQVEDEIAVADQRWHPAKRLDDARALEDLLSAFTPGERRVAILFALGYSYGEIAEICGWSWSSVKHSLERTRRRSRLLAEKREIS